MKKILMMIMFMPLMACAQHSDFGVWYTLGATKKVNKKLSVGIEAEMRTRNDSKTISRWTGELSASYKLLPWLKASAGYKFIDDNNREKITYHTDGTENNWRPSYWGVKHRFNVSLTGEATLGMWSISLRERWQYTYRPEKSTTRYDFDNEWWESTTVSGKGSNVLRSRLQVECNIPKCKVDPFASAELFNAWSIQKVRYTVGADWKIRKRHTLTAFYRFQDVRHNDIDDDPDTHVLGLGYNYKF